MRFRDSFLEPNPDLTMASVPTVTTESAAAKRAAEDAVAPLGGEPLDDDAASVKRRRVSYLGRQ